MFFGLPADESAVLLRALTYVTGQLDSIMATHDSQNTVVLCDLNQHVENRVFMDLKLVHNLSNHVTFLTHVHETLLCLTFLGILCSASSCIGS